MPEHREDPDSTDINTRPVGPGLPPHPANQPRPWAGSPLPLPSSAPSVSSGRPHHGPGDHFMDESQPDESARYWASSYGPPAATSPPPTRREPDRAPWPAPGSPSRPIGARQRRSDPPMVQRPVPERHGQPPIAAAHHATRAPQTGRKRATPWWHVIAAGILFFIALGVHTAYAGENSSCTISESSSSATIYDTPQCDAAFHASDISRVLMILAGAGVVGLSARRLLGR